MSVWAGLKRRNVFKLAVAYLVASWLIVQVVSVLTEPLDLPRILATVVVVLLAIGFPFALIFAWVYDVAPEGIEVKPRPGRARPASSRPGQRLSYVVVGMLAIAVGLMAADRYVLTPSSGESSAIGRLAVLPCTNLSPDPTNSFFADGIHAELITRLGSLSGLEVISRTSMLRYADGRKPVRQVAAELRVPAVMECFVRYSGDRVAMTTQLLDGASDVELWGDTYRADLTNLGELFEIQAEIAMNVANALRVEFFDDERERIERVPTQSREAYELYLAARSQSNQGPQDADAQHRALASIDAALEADPVFVDAWVTKARILGLMEAGGLRSDALPRRAERIEAVSRALELDPNNTQARLMLAAARESEGDWIPYATELRRRANGREHLADTDSVMHFLAVGEFGKAIEQAQSAIELDPLDQQTRGLYVLALGTAGDRQAANEEFERGQNLFGDVWFGSWHITLIRLDPGVRAPLEEIPPFPGQDQIRQFLDRPEEGLAYLRDLRAGNEAPVVAFPMLLAVWAAYWGDVEFALEQLEDSMAIGARSAYLVWAPVFREVRRAPRFRQLLRTAGLVEYWNAFGWPDICRPAGTEEFDCG